MTQTFKYLRGAFMSYGPRGTPDDRRMIPFRFNPESLSRQFSVEQGGGAGGPKAGAPAAAKPEAEQGADAASGALKETFSVQIRLDLADRAEDGTIQGLSPSLGIAPEIAALEELLQPVESLTEAPDDRQQGTKARPRRPFVLFIWGTGRTFPIRITGMTINETMHDTYLVPTRAEIDVSAEVLGEADARENAAVASALKISADNRRQMAAKFYAATASQSPDVMRP